MSERLNPAARDWLLRAARNSIRQKLFDDGALERFLKGSAPPPATHVERGAFVTLHQQAAAGETPARRLRGCVGTTSGTEPLHRAVIDLAPRSAMEDPRFDPLAPEEYETICISISVLTDACPITDPSAIVIGRHGVRLAREGKQSVFLPQVATEQRWNVDELLKHLSLKAGLAADGWRGATLFTFEAETFGEPA